jgi:hypothetical protein
MERRASVAEAETEARTEAKANGVGFYGGGIWIFVVFVVFILLIVGIN